MPLTFRVSVLLWVDSYLKNSIQYPPKHTETLGISLRLIQPNEGGSHSDYMEVGGGGGGEASVGPLPLLLLLAVVIGVGCGPELNTCSTTVLNELHWGH